MSAYGLKHEAELLFWYARDLLLWTAKYSRGRHFLHSRKFLLQGKEYSYFLHPYNHTWFNERAAEIPVIKDFVDSRKEAGEIMEVGNVLSHYFPSGHLVVDKYEHSIKKNVVNEDFLEFDPGRKFATIVSVSTLEHVGWDEKPRNPEKAASFLDRVRGLLIPGGQAILSVPLGYNDFLDAHLSASLGDEDMELRCLRRLNLENEWVETDFDTARHCRYGKVFPNGNAVAFIILKT